MNILNFSTAMFMFFSILVLTTGCGGGGGSGTGGGTQNAATNTAAVNSQTNTTSTAIQTTQQETPPDKDLSTAITPVFLPDAGLLLTPATASSKLYVDQKFSFDALAHYQLKFKVLNTDEMPAANIRIDVYALPDDAATLDAEEAQINSLIMSGTSNEMGEFNRELELPVNVIRIKVHVNIVGIAAEGLFELNQPIISYIFGPPVNDITADTGFLAPAGAITDIFSHTTDGISLTVYTVNFQVFTPAGTAAAGARVNILLLDEDKTALLTHGYPVAELVLSGTTDPTGAFMRTLELPSQIKAIRVKVEGPYSGPEGLFCMDRPYIGFNFL